MCFLADTKYLNRMKYLKPGRYFTVIVGIHLLFWVIDLYFYKGNFTEVSSTTFFFGNLKNVSYWNFSRIFGEILSSWVVTVFAFNFLMATRAKWIERWFGGLDKMYLVHRRSGIVAVVLLLLHFIFVPKDVTSLGIGKPLGFAALVLILLGVVLAASPFFKRKIPYHKWVNIHKLMGIFYVLGVIHGFTVNSLIRQLPITRVYVFGMALVGISAWIYRVFLFNLFNKKLEYKVTGVTHKSTEIVEILMKPQQESLQYLAGQFAFFTFPSLSKSEQHPFTMSSHPYQQNLRITVKNLGDFTARLNNNEVKIGDKVFVEGPYGHFSSGYIKEKEQIWVAGGIGITPFQSLKNDIYTSKVKLYWSVNEESEAVYKQELDEAVRTNLNFSYQIWDTKKLGYISADSFSLDNYRDKGYLICGPQPLKRSLIFQLKSKGVKNNAIYEEEFAFR